jgi:hypothetical protein
VTDANLSEKAAAAVDTAADAVKGATSSATTSVEKAANSAAADATKAAESAKAASAKAAAEVKADAAKASDATKAAATKATDATKATAAKAGDSVKSTVDKAAAGKPASAKPGEKAGPPPRSAAQIEADLDVVRARLAGRINDLEDYVAPKNVAKRGVDSAKRVFVDEYGGIKPDRVLMAVGAVVLLVGLRAVGRRRRTR